MLITSIEKQKRSKKRYNIYADGEFFCGLYADTILKFGLNVNADCSRAKLHEIKDYDEYIYGREAALNFLSYRVRTANEIRKKLKEKKLSTKITAKILSYLEESGLINDEEFARTLVEENIKRKPAGLRVLRKKLFEKGVPRQVGEKVLGEVFERKTACIRKF
jgi:regulatory protein